MSAILPRLRAGLDIFPSPIAERPGLLLRDPFRYTEEILIIPPLLARGLALFDGEQTELDLQAHFSRLAGEIVPQSIIDSLRDALRLNGFLETEEFHERRAMRHSQFAAAEVRLAAHAGTGYPEDQHELTERFRGYFESNPSVGNAKETESNRTRIGIAAPHVSPEGGAPCYAAAYSPLGRMDPTSFLDRTVVLLGTSHYGEPERFGLSRKQFVTPFGNLEVDTALVDYLEARAGDAIVMEDYCHSIEHSIEFQCVFLQHTLGVNFKILPILCGPFANATFNGDFPEEDRGVRKFFDALSELSETAESGKLFWVLGIDLAHIGRRYGDRHAATVYDDQMFDVVMRDHARLARVCAGDADGFLNLVTAENDPLKWCGFSPLYTFLRTVNGAGAEMIKYDQWNIDEESVVTFAALDLTQVRE